MPGNDLTTLRDIIPSSSTQQGTARANITTILTGIINDIEPKVTPAGLDMSSALNFLSGGVYSPVTNVGYLNLQDRATTPAVNESLYVTSNNLYFRDGSGNEIALTSAGAVAAAAGNIGGAGYGSPIEVYWDNTPQEYLMKKGAGTHDLADVVQDRARFSDGSAYFATLGAAASMAATLAFTLPQTHPGSTSVVTIDSSGNMDHSRDLSVDNVTVTGEFKHPKIYRQIPFLNGLISGANVTVQSNGGATGTCHGFIRFGSSATSANHILIPIEVEEGQTIDDIIFKQFKLSGTSDGLTFELFRETHGSGSTPVLDGVQVASTVGSTASGTISTTMSLSHAVVADSNYYLHISPTTGSLEQFDLAQIKVGVSRS